MIYVRCIAQLWWEIMKTWWYRFTTTECQEPRVRSLQIARHQSNNILKYHPLFCFFLSSIHPSIRPSIFPSIHLSPPLLRRWWRLHFQGCTEVSAFSPPPSINHTWSILPETHSLSKFIHYRIINRDLKYPWTDGETWMMRFAERYLPSRIESPQIQTMRREWRRLTKKCENSAAEKSESPDHQILALIFNPQIAFSIYIANNVHQVWANFN